MAEDLQAQIAGLVAALNQFTNAQQEANQAQQQANQQLQALAANQQQQQQAHGANVVSPYEIGALDLSSRTGQTLFLKGCEPVESKFSGKIEELYLFISDLKAKAELCQWNSQAHGILTIQKNNENLNLLDDYGQLTEEDVKNARIARDAGGDVRAKQNAIMMHECTYGSVQGDAKTRLVSTLNNATKDGPTTFFAVMSQTFTATFAHSQSVRTTLQQLNPNRFQYNITEINRFIRFSVRLIKAGPKSISLSDAELKFYIFNVYKKIKTPREWVSHIAFLENKASTDPEYKPEDIMNDAEVKQRDLDDFQQWKPSTKSPEEQIVALLAQMNKTSSSNNSSKNSSTRNNGRNNRSGNSDRPRRARQLPPFIDQAGKNGDKKHWQGKDWYYCDKPHRNGKHWVMHPPSKHDEVGKRMEARKNKNKSSNDKSSDDKKKRVVVDEQKIRNAMTALIESEPTDSDAAATAMIALLQENADEQSVESQE